MTPGRTPRSTPVGARPAGRRWAGALLVVTLLAAGCGDDDDTSVDAAPAAAGDDAAGDDAGGDGAADGGAAHGGEISLDDQVEVAPGTVLDLPECPGDWDPETGLTDDTITLAISLPESGPLAALGGIDDGMRAWFDQMDPVDGRTVELVAQDDAYDPARTLANVEEMLDTEEPFAFTHVAGTANNLAIRDILDEECVPQLFNTTGFPAWGDPATFPWTVGGLLSYSTEAAVWCTYIAEELGDGTRVAGLFMDNDFGAVYRTEVEACAEGGTIELVESLTHDPATPDVTAQVTTMLASDPEVIVLGTTGGACPQAMAALAASAFDGERFLSYTCQVIPAYFTPIDPAGEGVMVATVAKDASAADDPDVADARAALEAAGLDADQGAFFTGVVYAQMMEAALRQAAEDAGGLNRVSLMRSVWNADYAIPLALEGATLSTAGEDDAYLLEAVQLARYRAPTGGAALGSYEPVGDLTDVEGGTGSVTQPASGG